MFESIGGRRFFMTMGCAVMATGLLWFGKIDPLVFRDIVIATVAAYITGNTIQKVKGHVD